MLSKLRAPIFVQILLATLLPMILIFSVVLATIARGIFKSNAGSAREKTLICAQQSAEEVRSSFLRVAAGAELTATYLGYAVCDSSQARETAKQITKYTLQKTPSAYRIRMYFKPGENSFGTGDPFAHIYYNDGETITGHPLVLSEELDADIAAPWYEIPLEEGEPYHDSVSHGRFGPANAPVYLASTNYPVIRNGEVIGSVGMGMLYRKSFQFVDKWEADGRYRLLIVSEKGTILYASDNALIDRNLDTLDFTGGFLAKMNAAMQRNGSFMEESHSPVFGKESLICIYPVKLPVESNHIFIYLDTPTEFVYSEATASVRTLFLTFLGGLLLFIGSLFAATRNITNPIKKLTATADRIAHGQLDAARHDFSDTKEIRHEVDSLQNSLNLMFKELEESHNLKIAAMETEYEKKKLEETAAAKDRFFAHMSHEIRTPMNVILGMSEILLLEDLNDMQNQYARHIKVSAESLLDIINDILDLSRMESGELPLLPEHYNFKSLMENVNSMSQYLARNKGLTFNYKTTGVMPAVLYGDDGRLRQVLLNVIGNAVKFTENGTVTLHVRSDDETVSFEVTDTGAGIKQEDMQYLFEPFKQVNSEKNRMAEGTGLGLSICRNLLRLMGGAISVESEYGKGSTFRIAVPNVPGDAAKIRKPSDTLPTFFDSRAKVLVVDDSASNLKVAIEFLRTLGIVADTAASGQECLDMVIKTNYDLIFMDHMMPEMDGIETTKRIRALGGHFTGIPIIALTANAVIGSRELFLSSGMEDFLSKPIERRKLQTILAKWMPEEFVLRECRYTANPLCSAAFGQRADKESDLTGIIERAAELKDLDIRLGLTRVAENRELYEEMLVLIVDAIPAALEKMDAAVLAGDTVTLTNEAHKLKGELANLGAAGLSGSMKELESAGGDIAQFSQKLNSARPALEAFAAGLRGLLTETNADEPKLVPEDWGSFEDELRDLRKALASYNYEKSQEVISGLVRFDWGGSRDKHLETIRKHIKFFDYEAALSALNKLFPKLR